MEVIWRRVIAADFGGAPGAGATIAPSDTRIAHGTGSGPAGTSGTADGRQRAVVTRLLSTVGSRGSARRGCRGVGSCPGDFYRGPVISTAGARDVLVDPAWGLVTGMPTVTGQGTRRGVAATLRAGGR